LKERTAETCAFRSPGAHQAQPLNDVELDDGCIALAWRDRFDMHHYLDLGSTNPSVVDGKQLDRSRDHDHESTDLRIGQFRLTT
jgi:hypothetical protein